MTLSADRLRLIRCALESASDPRDVLDAIPDPRDVLDAEALAATRRPDVADRLQAARTARFPHLAARRRGVRLATGRRAWRGQ